MKSGIPNSEGIIEKIFEDRLSESIRSFQWSDQLTNSYRVWECDYLDDESDAISPILIQSTQIIEPFYVVALAFLSFEEVSWNLEVLVSEFLFDRRQSFWNAQSPNDDDVPHPWRRSDHHQRNSNRPMTRYSSFNLDFFLWKLVFPLWNSGNSFSSLSFRDLQ
jgi:hypothetical protein